MPSVLNALLAQCTRQPTSESAGAARKASALARESTARRAIAPPGVLLRISASTAAAMHIGQSLWEETASSPTHKRETLYAEENENMKKEWKPLVDLKPSSVGSQFSENGRGVHAMHFHPLPHGGGVSRLGA